MRGRGISENLGKGEKHPPLENGNATTPLHCTMNRSCWFLLQTIISFLSKIRGVTKFIDIDDGSSELWQAFHPPDSPPNGGSGLSTWVLVVSSL